MPECVRFSGDLTIRAAQDCRATLVEAFNGGPEVVFSVADDAVADLTFVQLIESGRRTARDQGRALALAAPASGSLREILERGGFLESADNRHFWLLETERH